jgi:hypothetical protein
MRIYRAVRHVRTEGAVRAATIPEAGELRPAKPL